MYSPKGVKPGIQALWEKTLPPRQSGGLHGGKTPMETGQRLEALAFMMVRPIAFAEFSAPQRASVRPVALEGAILFVDAQ